MIYPLLGEDPADLIQTVGGLVVEQASMESGYATVMSESR